MAWHAAGVLHLDIKPANIATTSTGDVVVLDAGVSRFTNKGSATVSGAVGTPGYIAPELQGNEPSRRAMCSALEPRIGRRLTAGCDALGARRYVPGCECLDASVTLAVGLTLGVLLLLLC